MTKLYKTLSVTLAVLFSVSFIGIHFKVKAEPVTATLAAATVTVAIGVIIGTLINELCYTIDDTVTAFERDSTYKSVMEENERIKLYEDTKAEIDNYLEKRKQELIKEGNYDRLFYQMSDSERITLFVNSQEYAASLSSSPTSAQRLALIVLSNFENGAPNIRFNETPITLSMKGKIYSNLYESCLQEFLSYACNTAVNIGAVNGIRQIIMSVSGSELFPELVAKYNIRKVYTVDTTINSPGSYYYNLLVPSDNMHYIVLVQNDITSGVITFPHPSSPSVSDVSSYEFRFHYTYNMNRFTVKSYWYYYNSNNAPSIQYLPGYSTDIIGEFYREILSVDFGDRYAFDFSDLASAEAFVADMAIDTTYDPSVDTDNGEIVINDGLTDIEKAVAAQQGALGTTDDLDIVINPGLSVSEDGTTTYDPSISVGGLELSLDIDVSETIDKFKTPGSITTKFPFSIPFDIYHIFNAFSANPVAPRFDVSFDLSSIGAEKYEFIIDLSEYDWIANIVRWFIYAIFLIGLAILTNKAIGRG